MSCTDWPLLARSTALMQHQQRPPHTGLMAGPSAGVGSVGVGSVGAQVPVAPAAPPVPLPVQNTPAPPIPEDNPQTPEQIKVMHDYEEWLIREQEVRAHRHELWPTWWREIDT